MVPAVPLELPQPLYTHQLQFLQQAGLTGGINEVLSMSDEPPVTAVRANCCSTSTGHTWAADSAPPAHPAPPNISPSARVEGDTFCSKSLPDTLCHCCGTGSERGKKKDKEPQKILLALKVSFISVIPFVHWEMQ